MAEYIYDQFRIIRNRSLCQEELESLTLLYMPLIGIDSFAVYMLLQSLKREESYSFKKIIDTLNFSSLKLLNQALDKLEAMNLVKTLRHETKGYGFDVLPPLLKDDFFMNEVLRAFLSNQIGSLELEKLEKKAEPKAPGYKNVSKKFSDVFRSTTETVEGVITKTFKSELVIENKAFNYTLFKLKVDPSLLPEEVLEDESFRTHIERIGFVYKLDEEEMRDVVAKTITVDHNMEYSSIARNAAIMFQKKYKVSGPGIETIKDDQFVLSGLDDNSQKIINMVENLSISDVLENITHIKPSVAEVKSFDQLSLNTNLSIPVINMLIIYVSTVKETLPGYNYFEKIAVNMSMAKVKTAYDALTYLTNNRVDKEKKVTSKPQGTKKVVKLPDWYQEYSASIQQQASNGQSVVEENKEELLKLVKDMFD